MLVSGEISIERSKKKAVLAIVGASVFVAGGLWMATSDVVPTSRRFDDPLFVVGVGWVSVVFFGACGLSALWGLFDGRPGLVLNEDGMYPFGKRSSSHFVSWADISGFEIVSIKRTRLLVVRLFDMDKYLANSNLVTRSLCKLSQSTCGGPIALTSNTLKIKFDDLVSLCMAYHVAYRLPTTGE